MTDPSFTPEAERELLAVFPDEEHAYDARAALLTAGVDASAIRIDESMDAVTSLRTEMHDELTRAWAMPPAGGPYPGTSARSMLTYGAILGGIAIPLALLVALIDFGATYPVRAIIAVPVFLAGAFAISAVLGPSSAAPRPAESPAVAGGSVLRVRGDSGTLRQVLAQHEALRIDEITHDGRPIGTVAVDRPDTEAETLKDVAANAGGDDYHPQR